MAQAQVNYYNALHHYHLAALLIKEDWEARGGDPRSLPDGAKLICVILATGVIVTQGGNNVLGAAQLGHVGAGTHYFDVLWDPANIAQQFLTHAADLTATFFALGDFSGSSETDQVWTR